MHQLFENKNFIITDHACEPLLIDFIIITKYFLRHGSRN